MMKKPRIPSWKICGIGSPIMCPIDTHIRSTRNTSDTTSRRFMRINACSCAALRRFAAPACASSAP